MTDNLFDELQEFTGIQTSHASSEPKAFEKEIKQTSSADLRGEQFEVHHPPTEDSTSSEKKA